MGNRQKRRKTTQSSTQKNYVDQFKCLVEECINHVRKMHIKDQSLAWEHWLAATETLRKLHVFLPKKIQIIIDSNDEDQGKHGNAQIRPSRTDYAIDIDTKGDPGYIDQTHPDGDKQEAVRDLEKIETKTEPELCGQESLPSVEVDTRDSGLIPSRRSTRKRQANPKFQDVYEMQHPSIKRNYITKITQEPKESTKRNFPQKDEQEENVQLDDDLSPSTSKLETSQSETQIEEQKSIAESVEEQKSISESILCHGVPSDIDNKPKPVLIHKEQVTLSQDYKAVQGLAASQTLHNASTEDVIEIHYLNNKEGRATADAVSPGGRSPKSQSKFLCPFCSKTFSRQSLLLRHQQRLHGDQTQEETRACPECGQTFGGERLLKKHIRCKHPYASCDPPKQVTCDQCSKTFVSGSNLRAHIELCHKGKRDFICGSCGKGFQTRSNLHRHEQTHTGLKPWKCFKCEARFTEKRSMERHAFTHTGLKLYKCQVCDKSLSTEWSLRQHQVQHEEDVKRTFLCDVCGKTFAFKSNLQGHRKVHLRDRPHPCTLCKRSFCGKGDLDRHMRSHTGEKPYDCQVCNKRFSRLEYLREHLNAHAGIMPYSCPTCNKGFTDRSGYHKHSKRCARKKQMLRTQMEEEDEVDDEEPEPDPEENIGQDSQEIHLEPPILDATENQVNFIDLDSQTSAELQVHQIFCTTEEVAETVTAEHVIELPSGSSTYTVLSDGQVTASAIADFGHQTASLTTEAATVETIGNEAQLPTTNLQWYVQDVVSTEPWQSID